MNIKNPARLKNEPMLELDSSSGTNAFVPRTDLGKRLMSLRNGAIDAGMRLLNEDEVLEEVRRRRGELPNDKKDLY